MTNALFLTPDKCEGTQKLNATKNIRNFFALIGMHQL